MMRLWQMLSAISLGTHTRSSELQQTALSNNVLMSMLQLIHSYRDRGWNAEA